MSSERIRQEDAPQEYLIPRLDTSLFQPTEVELQFLKFAISEDQDELCERIFDSQRRSYAEHSYPCIHSFAFVSLMMLRNEVYTDVLRRAKRGTTYFLDVGCCMGTDVRKLAYDGYPASNIFACDLRSSFLALGHDLYRDEGTSEIHFFAADIFSLDPTQMTEDSIGNEPSAPPYVSLERPWDHLANRMDHIYAGALFHLFDQDTQYAIARRLATVSTRSSGAIVFGRHQGRMDEGLLDDHLGRLRYGHSPASWKKMWVSVFETFGISAGQMKVDAALEDLHEEQKTGLIPETSRTMYWSVSVL